MNSYEKSVLQQAARIIQEKLKGGDGEVKIPGFGKLYLSRVPWTNDPEGTHGTVNTVRFKPFKALKEEIGDRRVDGGNRERSDNFASGGAAMKHEPASVVHIHREP